MISTAACWDWKSSCPGLKGIFGGRHTSNYLGSIIEILGECTHKHTDICNHTSLPTHMWDTHDKRLSPRKGWSQFFFLLPISPLVHQLPQNSWILSACFDKVTCHTNVDGIMEKQGSGFTSLESMTNAFRDAITRFLWVCLMSQYLKLVCFKTIFEVLWFWGQKNGNQFILYSHQKNIINSTTSL